jgi:apolipoprotein D and lipocalin family protein
MARERIPRGEILQAAYGVLDKYKMNRSFFVQTEQTNCETLPPPLEAIDPTNPTVEIKKMEPDIVASQETNEPEVVQFVAPNNSSEAAVVKI